MKQPSLKTIMDAVDVSKSYAAVIRSGQSIPLNLAAIVYRETGWRHPLVTGMSRPTLLEIARTQPWSSPKAKASAA